MKVISLRDKTTGVTIGTGIAVADSSLSRLCGLLGRRRLDAGCGVLLRPSSGVHTFGMTFPIDVVALDKQLRVLKSWRSLRPFRITSVSFKVHSVLELASGQIAQCGINIGDQLEIF